MVIDYINNNLAEQWKPFITKEELLERYWTKFLMYMYMEYTLIYETIPEFESKLEWKRWSKENWNEIIKEFWEINTAKYLISKFQSRWDKFNSEIIISLYDELIFQQMMDFLID